MNREIVKTEGFLKKIRLKFFSLRICEFSKFLSELRTIVLLFRASKKTRDSLFYVLTKNSYSSAKFVDDARNARIYTSGYGQMLSSFNVIHCIPSIKVSRINPKSAMPVFVKRAR